MTDENQRVLKLSLIPGKVIYAATQFLVDWNPVVSPKGEETLEDDPAESDVNHAEVKAIKEALARCESSSPASAKLVEPTEEPSDVQLFMTDEEDFQQWQDEVMRSEERRGTDGQGGEDRRR